MGGQQSDPANYYYNLQLGQRELGEPLLSNQEGGTGRRTYRSQSRMTYSSTWTYFGTQPPPADTAEMGSRGFQIGEQAFHRGQAEPAGPPN